jgi:hypothetical protein
VGEGFGIYHRPKTCWVGFILFACVCVGTSDMTTTSSDLSISSIGIVCVGCFPRGGLSRGAGMPLPGYVQCHDFVFWPFFAIFSGFVN